MTWEITSHDWSTWLTRDDLPMRAGVEGTGLDPLDAQLCSMLGRRPFAESVAFANGNGAAAPPAAPDDGMAGAAAAEALEITLKAGGTEVAMSGDTDAAPPAAAGEGEAFFIPKLTKAEAPSAPASTSMADVLDEEEDGVEEELEAEELEAEELEAEELEGAPEEVRDDHTPPPVPVPPPASASASAPPPRAPPPIRPKRHWTDDAFGDHFHALRRADHEDNAKKDVAFAAEIAALAEGATVLDVGCGDGAHCFALREAGFQPTGVDNSLAQLLRATQRNEREDAGVTFLHGDMRDLPVEETFDAVVSLGSSFGYYEDEQNRRILEGMVERLKPEGKLVMQLANRDHLVGRLPVRSWWQGQNCLVLDEAEMNFYANRLRVHRTVVFEDGRQFEHYVFVRAFSLHDVGKLMSSVGLRVLEVSGSRATRGSFFGSISPELWILAERKTGPGASIAHGRLDEPG